VDREYSDSLLGSGAEGGSPTNVPTHELIDALCRPAAFPELDLDPSTTVDLLQTHISLLFFTPERVYKVKKSVDLGFLDYTTLERRKHFCEEEVRLNRRLAPRTYLGVVPIGRDGDGQLVVGGGIEPLEWAVEMERLPAESMLSARLARGAIDNAPLNEVVDLLVRFHATAATGAGVDEFGSAEAIAENTQGNLDALADFAAEAGESSPQGPRVLSPRLLRFLEARRRELLTELEPLFAERVRNGRIREGHGDLHAGNLCFTSEGPVAYDCIEFEPAFRCGDVAADLAFLAMDLDMRGFPGFSGYLVHRYASVSGDAELQRLVGFYKGYRALVRAKVSALTGLDPELRDDAREKSRLEAMRYTQLAVAYELPPTLLLLCGAPSAGKTWLAERLTGSLRAAILRAGVRRRLLHAPNERDEPGDEAFGEGWSRAVDRSLFADALTFLRNGHSVLIDARFGSRAERRLWLDAAERLELSYLVVHVDAPDELRRARGASDTTTFEPPTEVPSERLVPFTSGADVPEEHAERVLERLVRLQSGP